MDLTFMGAALPLTKSFAYQDGQYTVAPYPHVARLTSFHERVETLDQFAHVLRSHAALAHCLFNGQLQRPLTNESRAQKTLRGVPREFITFDFDKVPLDKGETVVERYLPSYAHNVSYVEQVSASMFLPESDGLYSGHVFMLLKEACHEELIVAFIEHLNFTCPALVEQIELSKAKLTLHWPLDRSAGHDSKLIYIAPPRCVGFTPAITPADAIRVIRKKQPSLKIPADFKRIDKRDIDDKINQLRADENLDRLDLATRRFGEFDVLIKTPTGSIDSVRAVGDHYLKLNLNGGDSWAYWIDLRNPELIHNFKGEPSLLTKDVDEKFYKGLKAMAPQIVARPPLEEGAEVLAFYARNQSSQLKIGTFLPISRRIRLDNANETSANAWLWSWGVPRRGPLELYDVVFDPTSSDQYLPGTRTINMFRPTDYMLQQKSSNKPSTLKDLPRFINTLLRSVLGNPTEEELAHFVNWLAFIFRKRTKVGTAWILHGTKGTGKGKFFEHVLKPLLGEDVVASVQLGLLNTDFNSIIDNKLLVFVDESTQRSVDNSAAMMAKLEHWITEPYISIHAKGKDAQPKPSYTNFILASNEKDPVRLPEDDRRFNVARRQEARLFINPNDHNALMRGDELQDFADVLLRWPLDEEATRALIDNEARQQLHENTTGIGELIAEAIKKGKLGFFIEHMPTETESAIDFRNGVSPLGIYKTIIDAALAGKKDVLTADDLYTLFQTLIPDPKYFQPSKVWRSRYFRSLGLDTSRRVYSKQYGRDVRGFPVEWQIPEDAAPAATPKKPARAEKVVPIKPRKRA